MIEGRSQTLLANGHAEQMVFSSYIGIHQHHRVIHEGKTYSLACIATKQRVT